MERLVEILPASLFKGCSTFVLLGAQGSEIQMSFHPKEKTVGFGAPSSMPGQSVIEELVLGLELIQEKGMVTPKISSHRKSEILSSNQDLISECVGVLE